MKPGKNSASVRLKLYRTAALLTWVAVSLLPSFGLAQQSAAPKGCWSSTGTTKTTFGMLISTEAFKPLCELPQERPSNTIPNIWNPIGSQ
jgi:hypothetical protein